MGQRPTGPAFLAFAFLMMATAAWVVANASGQLRSRGFTIWQDAPSRSTQQGPKAGPAPTSEPASPGRGPRWQEDESPPSRQPPDTIAPPRLPDNRATRLA
jgi:hypothetical protein